jgi:pimeloyl-ACP methyl ester carboxylesterase
MMRDGVGFHDVRRHIDEQGFPDAFERLSLPALPENEAEWKHMAALIDYDPRPALERVEVPLLALFGAEDPIVPVEESVAVYRETVAPELLTVAVIAGGDHRVQSGEPPALADGYLEAVTAFILDAVATSTPHRGVSAPNVRRQPPS